MSSTGGTQKDRSKRPKVWGQRGWFAIIGVALALLPSPGGAHKAAFHVASRWLIGGEGGWDCLTADPEARRLYVTHGTRLEVLDLDSGKSLGAVPGIAGGHGVALAPTLGRGFVASGRDSAVVVFDLKTLSVLERLRVPARFPDALLYEPGTRRLFTFNGGSDNASAFDASSGAFIGLVALGGAPEFAVTDGAGRIYVNLENRNELITFDARSLAIEHRWPLAPGEEPTALAIDREHHRLFSGCHNRRLVVMDAVSGKILTTLPIGEGVDGVAFDPRRERVFASTGDGMLTAVEEKSPDRFEVLENDSTQRGARTLALDERTGRVFVVTASFGPPPEPSPDHPHPRPSVVPGTFVVLVLDH